MEVTKVLEEVLPRNSMYDVSNNRREDNHVDDDFLAWLVDNPRPLQVYDYALCVRETIPVIEEISLCLIFWCFFKVFASNEEIILFMCAIESLVLLSGLAVYLYLLQSNQKRKQKGRNFEAKRFFRNLGVVILFLYFLSPVMQTLTLSISGDTVHAMVVVLVILHLFSSDYTYINGYTEQFVVVYSSLH